jgi:tetratricopeptide (TPR) repeat protein
MATQEVAVAYNSAAASFNAGRVDEALALWESCVEPLSAAMQEAAGEGSDEARELLSKVHVNRGNACLRSGRFEDAIECYDRAVEDCEVREGLVYHRRALALRELRRFDEAADWEAAAVDAKDGDYQEARRGKTACYMALEDWERAEEAAREAVEAKEDDLPAVVELGFVLLRANKYGDAAAELGRARGELRDTSEQTAKLYASSLGLMAEELAKEGDLEEAAAAYEAAAQAETTVGRVYNGAVLRARAAERAGETSRHGQHFAKAIDGYFHAISLDPHFFPAHTGLGMAFMACAEFSTAAEVLANALALKDDDPRYLYNLGVALMTSERAKDAEPRFARALSLSPGFEQAASALAVVREAIAAGRQVSKDEAPEADSGEKEPEVERPYSPSQWYTDPERTEADFDGYGDGMMFPLSCLTSNLKAGDLPEGVDPRCREVYLSAKEFKKVFGMPKKDYYMLPKWKRNELKRGRKLF